MDSMEDIQFDLFVVYLLCKLNRFLQNNPNNPKIKNLISYLIRNVNTLSSPKIQKLCRRFLK